MSDQDVQDHQVSNILENGYVTNIGENNVEKVSKMGRWIQKGNILTYNPHRLKFYEDEIELFSEAYSRKLDTRETKIIFDKLCRHYKLRWISLSFNGRRGGGIAGGSYIQLCYNPAFGLLCHEIAHIIDKKKRSKSKHDKKLMRILGRVISYCKKKNWWEEELNRRTEIKIKPIPTKEELQTQKLEKRKSDLARYKKKLNYYTKLYSNKIKKAKRSIIMLEMHCKPKPDS